MESTPEDVPTDLGSDVPTIDFDVINLPDLDTNVISSPSGGACPAPSAVSVFNSSIELSYQPFCDLATALHPYFLALGWLLAAFIVFRGGPSAI
jgi:hypothetical protein